MPSAYLANARTNAKSYKILVRVQDLIAFLQESEYFGKAIEFEPNKKQTRWEFCNEVLSSFDDNGIVAIIIPFNDASGHITLFDINERRFVDDKNYLNGEYEVERVYFWKFNDIKLGSIV